METLIWTCKLPTKEGYFWMSHQGEIAVVKIRRFRAFGDRLCTVGGVYDHRSNPTLPVEECKGAQWAGPVVLPSGKLK